jgi:hypothetical protein
MVVERRITESENEVSPESRKLGFPWNKYTHLRLPVLVLTGLGLW